MKIKISLLLLFTLNLSAQENKWKTEISDEGKTEVVYAIYDSVNVDRRRSYIY